MHDSSAKVNPSEETIRIGSVVIHFLLTGDHSNGKMSVFEFSVPAGERLLAPAHKNDAFEETLYGIEGVLTWTLDGVPVEVGPGQALCIPCGVVHRFDNPGTQDAKQLAVLTPAIMGPAYFREAAELMREAAGTPPARARMIEVFRRHGMRWRRPPRRSSASSAEGAEAWRELSWSSTAAIRKRSLSASSLVSDRCMD